MNAGYLSNILCMVAAAYIFVCIFGSVIKDFYKDNTKNKGSVKEVDDTFDFLFVLASIATLLAAVVIVSILVLNVLVIPSLQHFLSK